MIQAAEWICHIHTEDRSTFYSDPGGHSDVASGLLCFCGQRAGCGQAQESGEERDGGVGGSWS